VIEEGTNSQRLGAEAAILISVKLIKFAEASLLIPTSFI
jgi:hypothetical protein